MAHRKESRGGYEDYQAENEERLAPVQVAQAPGNGRRNGGGDHVGGGDPYVTVKPAEVGYDAGQRGGYGGLTQRGQEHHQRDAGH